ncbi:hypothetical protein BGZ75_006102 [Mortierella antarctica]|nr:hypothetical protein BGZ75_006102 [Mortierella antarctica]
MERAVDIAVDRTVKHLNDDDVKNEWRLPYTFWFPTPLRRYAAGRYAYGEPDDENDGMPHADGGPNTKGKNLGAKYLIRFLKGVLKEDVPLSQNLTGKTLKHSGALSSSSVAAAFQRCCSLCLLNEPTLSRRSLASFFSPPGVREELSRSSPVSGFRFHAVKCATASTL